MAIGLSSATKLTMSRPNNIADIIILRSAHGLPFASGRPYEPKSVI